MIYLDNAATSWPKPPEVKEAMAHFLDELAGNPGRSGHGLSVEAGRVVYDARELVAGLFNVPDPLRVIFTMNATHALNLALNGILSPGDRAVTTGMEHNSVMRPLRALEREGVEVVAAKCSNDGRLDLASLEEAASGAKMVVINHASNVVGTLQDIEHAGRIAHAAGAMLLVDAAQTAGVVPIDVQNTGIDLLAFSGHKGLLGPTGTGGLVIGENVDVSGMRPLVLGGTGSSSGKEEQPERLPDKFESGTPNSVGIAGLAAGIRFVLHRGLNSIRKHEMKLAGMLIDGLRSMERVRIYGTCDPALCTAVVSFTVEGMPVSRIGLRLEEEFAVMSRVGLHCAPAAHKSIRTFPGGTVRLAPGIFTTPQEIEQALAAVRKVAQS